MDNIEYKNFTETDVDLIKNSLKTYLQNQDTFKDYNFDGSAIAILLNLLAYNTQYNAYYINMLASEKFINKAQKRKSLVELANNFGYIPASYKSSTAYLSFDLVQDVGYTAPIVIPKNTTFKTVVDGTSYKFLTTSNTIVRYNTTTSKYHVDDLEVKEGLYFSHKYTITKDNEFLLIPNGKVDVSRIVVKVKQNSSASDTTAVEYSYYSSVLDVDSSSLVYYIQETDNEKYQIYFGDNVLGKSIEIGNQVIVEYYVCSGSAPNGANVFFIDDDLTGLNYIQNVVASRASNGYEIESMNSIRLSVRNSYQAQNRAVTPSDYKVKLKELIPNATDISVWGGEDASPKQYGKVFISAIKENFGELSSIEKTEVINKLYNNYMVLSITPEFVDVNLINVEFDIQVRLAKNNTKTLAEIVSIVHNAIIDNVAPITSKFGAEVYESKVEEYVNYSVDSIISNISRFSVYYELEKFINTNNTIKQIQFPINIQNGSVYSTDFLYNDIVSKIEDLGDGKCSITQNGIVVYRDIMTVDYSNGLVSVNDVSTIIDIITNNDVRLYGTPETPDIVMVHNNILKFDENDIKVTINE